MPSPKERVTAAHGMEQRIVIGGYGVRVLSPPQLVKPWQSRS
jgi:hypothetical protein